MVSYTSTVEGPFGSGLMVGGFFLNNELTDFSRSPDIDGKLVANRVEGGKRPRSSMSPTVVWDPQGRPFLAIGAAGGSTIPVQTARSIIGAIDFGLSAEAMLGLPFIMAYDLDVEATLQSKKTLFDRALADNWLCLFGHDRHHGTRETPNNPSRRHRAKVTGIAPLSIHAVLRRPVPRAEARLVTFRPVPSNGTGLPLACKAAKDRRDRGQTQLSDRDRRGRIGHDSRPACRRAITADGAGGLRCALAGADLSGPDADAL
jgi:hypothetical protein